MRQAWHIFKKDVRHLRLEISIALAAVAGFTFALAREARSSTDPATTLGAAPVSLTYVVPLVWVVLIARLIYGEPLVGYRQFWLTRPYSRKSLLAAKALFILVFVNLALFIADVIILRAYEFRIASELGGLLWTQVLLTAGTVLPAAALCAVTTGFVQLSVVVSALGLAIAGWNLASPELDLAAPWRALEWARSYSAGLVVTLAAAVIVARQYGRKGTGDSQLIACGAILLVLMVLAFLPWPAAFALQSLFSRPSIDPGSIRISYEPDRISCARALVNPDQSVQLSVPLRMTGLPAPLMAILNGVTAEIEGPGGALWRADRRPWTHARGTGELIGFQASLDPAFYRRVKDQPLRIRGSAYLTLYGNPRRAELPLGDQAVFVPTPGVGLCAAVRTDRGMHLICRSAFRSRPDLVTFNILGPPRFVLGAPPTLLRTMSGFRPPSYSPFPADSMIPVTQSMQIAETANPVTAVRSLALEPVAHIRREFELAGVRLGEVDLSAGPPPQPPKPILVRKPVPGGKQ